jgi:glycosyltransferase involved in cell wall biosynthesis
MELERMVLAKGLYKQIEFIGDYSEQDLSCILHKHDLYVSASLWNGIPNSLLEAMATGLLPIVSRTEANKRWFREGESALMFECGNAEELAEQIVCAVSDSGFCRRAIEVNRRVVEERADREKSLLQVEE